jgi:hypothetical protein
VYLEATSRAPRKVPALVYNAFDPLVTTLRVSGALVIVLFDVILAYVFALAFVLVKLEAATIETAAKPKYSDFFNPEFINSTPHIVSRFINAA